MHERSVGRVPVLSRVGPVYKKEKERISVCVYVRENEREGTGGFRVRRSRGSQTLDGEKHRIRS